MKFQMTALALTLAPLLVASATAQAAERYCREYTRTITIGGRAQSGYGTACYQPDGSWEIVSLSGPETAREAVHQDMLNDWDRGERIVVVDRRPVEFYSPLGYRPVYYTPWPPGHHRYWWNNRHHEDRRHDRRHGHRDWD